MHRSLTVYEVLYYNALLRLPPQKDATYYTKMVKKVFFLLRFIKFPSSFVLRPSSFVLRPSSFVLRPSSFILHLLSLIHPSSFILYPYFVLSFTSFSKVLNLLGIRHVANTQIGDEVSNVIVAGKARNI